MYIKFLDEEDEYTKYQYDKQSNIFNIISRQDGDTIECKPPIGLSKEYNPDNFQLYFFNNERTDCTENSIFQVYVGKVRIGWIFPVQALLSSNHNYWDNPYFLKYAYVAYCLLLQKIESRDQQKNEGEISIGDFYKSEKIILILDKDNCNNIEDFLLSDYAPYLYKYGYSVTGKGNIDAEIARPNIRISLHKISSELRQIEYISTMFEQIIPQEQEAFARFHTYYQIIEIFISMIFEHDFRKFIGALNFDTENLFEKRDELTAMSAEKGRICKLFNDYVQVDIKDRDALDEQCKDLLKNSGRGTFSEFYLNLYAVRCLLVHRLYSLDGRGLEILHQLNIIFLDIIIEMLVSFHIPD